MCRTNKRVSAHEKKSQMPRAIERKIDCKERKQEIFFFVVVLLTPSPFTSLLAGIVCCNDMDSMSHRSEIVTSPHIKRDLITNNDTQETRDNIKDNDSEKDIYTHIASVEFAVV